QAPRNIFQGAEVIAGPVLRRDEQDEHMDRLSIETVEGHPGAGQGDGADQPLDAGVLGMRGGDASADAGGAEQFAVQDGLNDIFELAPLEVPRAAQALDHLAYHPFLGGGRQLWDDRLADHEIGHAHAWSPFGPPRAWARLDDRSPRTYSSLDPSGTGVP